MTNWPTKEEVKRVKKKLSRVTPSKVPCDIAGPVEQEKYKICEQFVMYMNSSELTQNEFAKKAGIDPSEIDKIVHYHLEAFTLDKLYEFLSKIDLESR